MRLNLLQFLSWYWLLLIPLLWGFLIYWYQRPRSSQTASIADVELSEYNHFYHPLTDKLIAANQQSRLPGSNQCFWKNPRFWLYGLLFSLLVISLAQPVLQGKRLPDPPPERDIVFLVDTSLSMQLKDYTLAGKEISRMELLRSLLDEFTTRMQGERISVILFAEKPYILVPLTSEQNLIRKMLGRITTTLAGRYAALGEALMMALNETKQQQGRHQTFILFTDENTSRGQVTASAAAHVVGEHGIPIFTIGIGSSQIDENASVSGGLYQALDLALLEDISKRSNGQSFQVNNAEAMEQALNDILKQRQNIAIAEPQYELRSLYFYPLSIAILLLMLWQIYRLFMQSREAI